MYKILEKVKLNQDVDLMKIHAPYVVKHYEPGQFIILRVNEEGERIPLTVAEVDKEKGIVTIVYQKVGYSTKLLGELNVGDHLADFAGPLGKGAHITPLKRVLGIAGGVGTAPLLPQLKKYHELGAKVDVIIGGRTDAHVILGEQFEEFCDNVYYATNDGSLGKEGFVTDVFNDLLEANVEYDKVITIGPVIMMKAVLSISKPLNIPTDVSLNPIMIDGTGMCGGCRVTVNGETKFACVDGPEFDGFAVDFDGLMTRQGYYKDQEKHICTINGK